MSPESLSDRFLRVGRHPFKACIREQPPNTTTDDDESAVRATDTRVCCCTTASPLYSRCWPAIFLVSAITDFPFPLPKDKKPGQHRDWGWVPVLVILAVIAFLYYGYLAQVNLPLLRAGHQAQVIVYLVPLHIWCVFLLASYARVVSQAPGHPKKLSKDSANAIEDEKEDRSLANQPCSILGGARWCSACNAWKPDRAHHCRVCDACVLRMDHHCPWVNGCVGQWNYRYFIQFICYVSGAATWIFATTLSAFIMHNGLKTFNAVALVELVISGSIMVVIGTFTCSHLWLVLLNRTTIENNQLQKWQKKCRQGNDATKMPATFTSSGKNVFFQGIWSNWTETMGEHWWQWLFPIGAQKRDDNDEEKYHFGFNPTTLEEYRQDRLQATDTRGQL